MQNDSVYAYLQGSNYEIFMHRAFRTSNRSKPGMDGSTMKNLIDAENGESWVRHLGSFEKQLTQIKVYMNKAIDKYLEMKLPVENLVAISLMKSRLDQANSSAVLINIIDETIELTQIVKKY
jgi:hypothetical protein